MNSIQLKALQEFLSKRKNQLLEEHCPPMVEPPEIKECRERIRAWENEYYKNRNKLREEVTTFVDNLEARIILGPANLSYSTILQYFDVFKPSGL